MGATNQDVYKKIISIGNPKRGDIVVFREPAPESRNLIKRIIGIPGDHISYKNKILYINGMEISQHFEQMRHLYAHLNK